MIKFVIAAVIAGFLIQFVCLRDKEPVPTAERPTVMDIPTLLSKANSFDGRQVTVTGTVIHSAAVMGVGTYRLQQDDAELAVLSSHGIPEVGTRATVSGIFKQAVSLNKLQYSVIFER